MPLSEPSPTVSPSRGPLAVSIVALLVASIALVLVVLDGSCRPEPVPVDAPHPSTQPVTDGQLRTSDPGEVRP